MSGSDDRVDSLRIRGKYHIQNQMEMHGEKDVARQRWGNLYSGQMDFYFKISRETKNSESFLSLSTFPPIRMHGQTTKGSGQCSSRTTWTWT